MKKKPPSRDLAGKFLKGHKIRNITPKELDILVDEYCSHRAKGLDKNSFRGCDYRTIERNASILQTEKIRIAEAQGWGLWESVAVNIALGISETLPDGRKVNLSKASVTMAIFLIKNKMKSIYGQSDKEPRSEEKPENQDVLNGSTPFTIIDPETNQIIELEIGAAKE